MTYYPARNDDEHRPISVYGVVWYDGYSERGEVCCADVHNDYFLIPTVYLPKDIQIVDGRGSNSYPYIIG